MARPYENTTDKTMGASSSLVLAVHVGDHLSRDQVYGVGLGWATGLFVHPAAQRIRRYRVFSGGLCD
jgi:hypothetical protein